MLYNSIYVDPSGEKQLVQVDCGVCAFLYFYFFKGFKEKFVSSIFVY